MSRHRGVAAGRDDPHNTRGISYEEDKEWGGYRIILNPKGSGGGSGSGIRGWVNPSEKPCHNGKDGELCITEDCPFKHKNGQDRDGLRLKCNDNCSDQNCKLLHPYEVLNPTQIRRGLLPAGTGKCRYGDRCWTKSCQYHTAEEQNRAGLQICLDSVWCTDKNCHKQHPKNVSADKICNSGLRGNDCPDPSCKKFHGNKQNRQGLSEIQMCVNGDKCDDKKCDKNHPNGPHREGVTHCWFDNECHDEACNRQHEWDLLHKEDPGTRTGLKVCKKGQWCAGRFSSTAAENWCPFLHEGDLEAQREDEEIIKAHHREKWRRQQQDQLDNSDGGDGSDNYPPMPRAHRPRMRSQSPQPTATQVTTGTPVLVTQTPERPRRRWGGGERWGSVVDSRSNSRPNSRPPSHRQSTVNSDNEEDHEPVLQQVLQQVPQPMLQQVPQPMLQQVPQPMLQQVPQQVPPPMPQQVPMQVPQPISQQVPQQMQPHGQYAPPQYAPQYAPPQYAHVPPPQFEQCAPARMPQISQTSNAPLNRGPPMYQSRPQARAQPQPQPRAQPRAQMRQQTHVIQIPIRHEDEYHYVPVHQDVQVHQDDGYHYMPVHQQHPPMRVPVHQQHQQHPPMRVPVSVPRYTPKSQRVLQHEMFEDDEYYPEYEEETGNYQPPILTRRIPIQTSRTGSRYQIEDTAPPLRYQSLNETGIRRQGVPREIDHRFRYASGPAEYYPSQQYGSRSDVY